MPEIPRISVKFCGNSSNFIYSILFMYFSQAKRDNMANPADKNQSEKADRFEFRVFSKLKNKKDTPPPYQVNTSDHSEVDAVHLQTLFEFDPSVGDIFWSDAGVAAKLTGVGSVGSVMPLADYENLIREGGTSDRQRVFAGEELSYQCEYQLQHADQSYHWVEERGGWIGQGDAKRLIGVIRSVEDEKSRDKHLSWLAQNDELTGLLNRHSLRNYLDDWLSVAQKTSATGAYFLVGIDQVGGINADFGFEVADQVILEIAKRLERQIAPDDYIGRVAGTKFGVLINECGEDCIRELSAKILNCVRESVIETARGGVAASVSLGAVTLPQFAEDSQRAMACAEAALDEAKRLGRANWAVFSKNTDNISMRQRNSHLSDVILTALNERRIQLAFQPIVTDMEQKPSKFECLIRMRSEDGKEIPAPEFIPAAERLGLVHFLDRRVLELAINTLKTCPNINLAVNISMETVKDFVWAEGYIAHLRANQSLARRITVELTETQVVDAVDASIEFVSEIKKLGCNFAIDDFGAGYTSFRNLKALDIDILKIDGSFVTGLASSRENQLFVRTLLDLARNFEMKTVAEWVDNEADAMLLKGLGVDFLQGYLIGKPEVNPAWLPEGAPNKPATQRR